MVLNHLLEDVPNQGVLLLHEFLRLFDRGAVPALLESLVDEWLEQLESHLLRQSALVQLQLRSDDDHRAARIIDPFPQQVLAEAPLLALEGVGERLQRPIIGSAQHVAATSVIEQRINGLLQHSLFIAHDHIGRIQLHQLLEPVVAINDAAIEVIEIRRGESASIERN